MPERESGEDREGIAAREAEIRLSRRPAGRDRQAGARGAAVAPAPGGDGPLGDAYSALPAVAVFSAGRLETISHKCRPEEDTE